MQKYLDRANEIVQCRCKKFARLPEETVFNEIDKVIQCQLKLNINAPFRNDQDMMGTIITGIPLVDIIINIDLFTAHFEDRNKILTIVKELFNHCNNMKRLLLEHHKLILTNLMDKYDKKCTLYENIE